MKREIPLVSGLLLALLALMAQLTLASAVPVTTISLADVTTLCQHRGVPGAPPAPAHRMPDCQLCLVCHGALGPFGLLSAPPALPQPPDTHVEAVTLPLPPTAAPHRFVFDAQPRGPPIRSEFHRRWGRAA
jgi:hypothetical protein